MPDVLRDIAKQTVDMVLEGKCVREVCFQLVSAAGFRPKEVVEGVLSGNYRDQDGSRTGETYPINSFCAYKVINQEGDDDYFATGWLDCAFRLVARSRDKNRERLIAELASEIEQSIPLEPVKLTLEGDTLSEFAREPYELAAFPYFVKHRRDEDVFDGLRAGMHTYCHGTMECHRATKAYDVLVCKRCYLRVLFPCEAKTYGELREALPLAAITVYD